jgi:hypothetical protein
MKSTRKFFLKYSPISAMSGAIFVGLITAPGRANEDTTCEDTTDAVSTVEEELETTQLSANNRWEVVRTINVTGFGGNEQAAHDAAVALYSVALANNAFVGPPKNGGCVNIYPWTSGTYSGHQNVTNTGTSKAESLYTFSPSSGGQTSCTMAVNTTKQCGVAPGTTPTYP